MIQINSDQLQVSILEKGAELCSVQNKNGLEFLWRAQKEIWPRHAPVLFPIVGKLRDDQFSHNNKFYKLSQHGFARDQTFILVEKTDQSCKLELRSDEQTFEKYPFQFVLHISYQLDGNALKIKYEIDNPSQELLLFSIGAHPGFSTRLTQGESLSNFVIEFERRELEISLLKDGLRSGEKKKLQLTNSQLPLSVSLFDNDALVFENKQIDRVRLFSKRSGHSVTLECNAWPYFGIWSKKGCRDFVCLEPWYGIADRVGQDGELKDKDGIIRVLPLQRFSCDYSVTFI